MLFFILGPIQLIISSCAFFLFQAKSIREYIQSLNVTMTLTICVILISISKWKMDDILKLIEKFEQFIEKRKRMHKYSHEKCNFSSQTINSILCDTGSVNVNSKSMYLGLNDEIERTSKHTHTVLIRFTLLGTLLPFLFQTVISYFILNRSDDTFYLPFFVVYVNKLGLNE